jgi:hypothetical protein
MQLVHRRATSSRRSAAIQYGAVKSLCTVPCQVGCPNSASGRAGDPMAHIVPGGEGSAQGGIPKRMSVAACSAVHSGNLRAAARAFWSWQRRHGSPKPVDRPGRPGRVLAQSQPSAVGNPGDMLTMTRALIPFTHDDGTWMTSVDCVEIEGQLGYGYGPGSLDGFAEWGPITDVVDCHRASTSPGSTGRRWPGRSLLPPTGTSKASSSPS